MLYCMPYCKYFVKLVQRHSVRDDIITIGNICVVAYLRNSNHNVNI